MPAAAPLIERWLPQYSQFTARATGALEAPPRSSGWDALVDDFIENSFAAVPPRGVRAGRHEFDGQLPALTPESFRRQSERLHAFRERARAFDAASLDQPRRF